MRWEKIDETDIPDGKGLLKSNIHIVVSRAKVPGGWLVLTVTRYGEQSSNTTVFCPDPSHSWDATAT